MRPRATSLRARTSPVRATSGAGEGVESGRKHRPDYYLLAFFILLLAIGLVVVYAISPALSESVGVSENYYANKQMIAIALSLVAFTIMARMPLPLLKKLQTPLIVAAIGATLLAMLLPVNPDYPAHRWVRLGGFSFQSVELLKLALLLWLSNFLSIRMQEGTITDSKKTFRPLLIGLAVLGFVVAGVQSDLGSTGVLVAMIGIMIFVAGFPLKRVLAIGAIILLLTTIAVASTPYRRERLEAFLDPTANCQTTGYQACQALIAIGSGGAMGLGLGSSVQAYGYLPEAANDSIFAIYAEKFGFIGGIVLLALFAALFTRIASIAERAPDNFSRLLVIGILTWLSIQTLINVGAMIGLLPLKGITLPFISYGGTSMVFSAAAMGIVFRISQFTSFGTPRDTNTNRREYDNRRDRRGLRGAYHPNTGSRS